jgi:hypothetical protein
MPLDFQLLTSLQRLLHRSLAQQVNWQRGEDLLLAGSTIGSEYLIRFPSSILSITHVQPPDQPEYILIKMCNPEGRALTTERVPPNDPNWDILLQLYKSASQSPSLWSPLVDEIREAIDGSSPVGLEPDLATVEAAKKFFLRIAGSWHLRWNTGEEDLRIDEFGNYFVITNSGEEIKFTLEKVLFDTSTNHVSFDKIYAEKNQSKRPKGQRHSREVLDISEDMRTMQGYDEPFRSTVKYTKTDTGNAEEKKRA